LNSVSFCLNLLQELQIGTTISGLRSAFKKNERGTKNKETREEGDMG
jgi:hypothetical protein